MPAKSKSKAKDKFLFMDGQIKTEHDWKAYLAQERRDMLKIMPEWAVANFQDRDTTKYVMATCRRLGKSTWSIVFALYRLTRLAFVNHVIAVKYFVRIKNTVLGAIKNALTIMERNGLLGDTPDENYKNRLEIEGGLEAKEFVYNGRAIIFTSLEKPENALGVQAVTFAKTELPVVFNMFIVDELMYQNDGADAGKSLTYADQEKALDNIQGSMARGLPNPFVHLTTIILFNSWDAEHPVYLNQVEARIHLLSNRYASEQARNAVELNRQELIGESGSGVITCDDPHESDVDGRKLRTNTKVVVASYLAIPKERRFADPAVFERFSSLMSETRRLPDGTEIPKSDWEINRDLSQWEIEFGGLPGSAISDDGKVYITDYRYADSKRLDFQKPDVRPLSLAIGFDRGRVDASSLFMGVWLDITDEAQVRREVLMPVRTEIWFGEESRKSVSGGFAVRDLKGSIDYIVDSVVAFRDSFGGFFSNQNTTVFCDSRANDFIESFNNDQRAKDCGIFMFPYDGKDWQLDKRLDTIKLALLNGAIRFPDRDVADVMPPIRIDGAELPLFDNLRLEESLKNCRNDPKKPEMRNENPHQNSYYVDVLNSLEIAVAERKYTLWRRD